MKERLIELRKYFKLSQADFAGRLGMAQSTYAPLETGREIRDAYVKLICQCYHVSEKWFRDGIEPMFTDDRDRELDELLRLYEGLTPALRQFLLNQARELQGLQDEMKK